MRRELHYFDIFPKVVPVKKVSSITIRCRERYFIPLDGYVKIAITPMTEIIQAMHSPMEIEARAENGVVKFDYSFEKEQEYRLRLAIKENEWVGLSIYALENDLYELIPLKGDTHVHTTITDGWESPEAVCSYYRKAGFDFLSISDHRKYEGAGIARRFYENANIDLEIMDAEEIHAPNNPIHIVNLGGKFCVSDVYRNDEKRYYSDVQKIMDSLNSSIVFCDDQEKFVYASCLWVYEKIREAGGMAVLAHPHALVNGMDAYNVQDSLLDLQFRNKCFDVLELVGGRSPVEVNMQLAFYYTACKNGYGNFPIIGGSDAHEVVKDAFESSSLRAKGVRNRPYGFGEFYTIVFAKANKTAEILSAIKKGYSVAIDEYSGSAPRVHGDYRLVSYALFLLSEYFPLRDEVCYEEGRLMLEMAYGGSKRAEGELRARGGRIDEFRRKYLN